MNIRLSRKFPHLAIFATAALLFAPAARACDACNLTFTQELSGVRAGSLVADDVRRAVENQRGLRLDGLGTEHLKAAIEDGPQLVSAGDAAVPGSAPPARVAATSARPPSASAGLLNPLPPRPTPDFFKGADFIEIIERDHGLSIPATSFVPQDVEVDKTFTIRLNEGKTYLGNGVVYDGFLTNDGVPGPTFVMDEGDIIEFVVINEGTVPHGASIHAAYTQTSKYVGKIGPGETRRVKFRATHPGVFMYHCAPGGHAIPMHVLFGQYGMMVVRPKTPYRLEAELGRKPDVELFLVQHELYDSGKAAVDGHPAYTMFNGKLFRYVEEPIKARPGDYVRINFLNIGPNLLSTFHIVGILWDYVYWQGQPTAVFPGGQSVTAGPSDSFVIEFRIPPDEGAYTMLTHAVGSASRGAIGLIVADRENEPAGELLADGPTHGKAEIEAIAAKAVRTISPFKPSPQELANPVVYGPEADVVTVRIIGNSYNPKVVQIAPGTTVRWVNEDAFVYLAGEYAGVHNAASTGAEEGFISPLLAHGESFEHTFAAEGEFPYICTPHPYMEGMIIVKQPKLDLALIAKAARGLSWWVAPLLGAALLLGGLAFGFAVRRRAA